MELKKKNLEKFIEKIESRGGSFDKEGMYGTIPADDSTYMHFSVRDTVQNSPDYLVQIDCGPGGRGNPVNVDESKVRNDCKKILDEISRELESEEC